MTQHTDAALSNTRSQTLELLLQTALLMLEHGWFPSVTELAAASGVSRATAYRYFPSQAALASAVVEASLGPVLKWEPTNANIQDRVRELIDFTYPQFDQHEGALRAALQVSLQQWAHRRAGHGSNEPQYERGNRKRILSRALEPIAGVLEPASYRRLTHALSVLYGVEPLVVLKDIFGLQIEEVQALVKWMSSALIEAALDEAALKGKTARRNTDTNKQSSRAKVTRRK